MPFITYFQHYFQSGLKENHTPGSFQEESDKWLDMRITGLSGQCTWLLARKVFIYFFVINGAGG